MFVNFVCACMRACCMWLMQTRNVPVHVYIAIVRHVHVELFCYSVGSFVWLTAYWHIVVLCVLSVVMYVWMEAVDDSKMGLWDSIRFYPLTLNVHVYTICCPGDINDWWSLHCFGASNVKCTCVHGVAFFINRWEAGIGWTLQVPVGMGHNIGQSSLKLWSTA